MRIDLSSSAVSSAGGQALGHFFGAAAALRRKKPLHPRGSVVPIRLVRRGLHPEFGVPWLDEPGVDTGIARFSRSIGLPDAVPDILGLAIRLDVAADDAADDAAGDALEDAEGSHDLLLATTGRRPVMRSVLVPRRTALTATYGSLFPYETPRGNIVFGAWPVSLASDAVAALTMAVASPTGGWRELGLLEFLATPEQASDETLDFDPVLHPLPGLSLARGFAALREPAYASARAHRPDSQADDT